MKVETFLGVLFAIIYTCQSSTLVVDVVEIRNIDNYTFVCNVPSSTNLTRWTYLSGPTGISLMSYQNGRCSVSPSNSFLFDSKSYSYTCNSTAYQVTVQANPDASRNNRILSCKDAHQLDSKGSPWIIKTRKEDGSCSYCEPTMTFDVKEITEGDNVTFTCKVSSDVPYVVWNRNIGSETTTMSGQYGACTTASSSSFLDNTVDYFYSCNKTVYQVTRLNIQIYEHNDIYMCTPPNQIEGTGSNWIIKVIKAQVKSVTITPPGYLVNAKEKTIEEFTCTASIARPAATIYWYRHPNGQDSDETQITSNITTTTDYYDLSVTTSKLSLFVTRQDNDTKVFCRANNEANTTMLVSRNKILLNVIYKADYPYIPEEKEYKVIENAQGTVACTVKGGNPTPTLTWECNGVSLTNKSTFNSNRTITTLVWTPLRTNGGTCTCTSKQTGFQDETVDVVLDVFYEASITSFIIEGYTQETVTINEDDPVRFVCIVDSNPTATMTLSHDSKTLNTKTTNILEYNVTEASCLDAGIYVCDEYNRANSRFAVLKLQVKCHPRAAKYVDGNLKTDTGSSITIVLDVIAYPPPTFKWYQLVNGTWTLLTENDKYRMSSSAVQSNLTIHSVGTNDFTSYKVISANDFGNMEQEYTLSPYGEDSYTSPGLLIGSIIGGTIGIIVLVALGIIVVRRHGYLNACFTIRKSQDNTINSPVEESAYNNIDCVPEYEMITQGNRESTPYSSLELTQQSATIDNQNERKKDVYENL